MEVNTLNFGSFDQGDENFTELYKKEKYKLSKLISARISVIKSCKRNLIVKTKIVIKGIEEILGSSLKIMDSFIDSLFTLMHKDEYNAKERSIISDIKLRKILALPLSLISLDSIKKSFNKDHFEYQTILNNNIKEKLKAFRKYNYEKLTLILKSQDKSLYVTGGVDGVIRIWDYKGDMKEGYYYGQNEITALALSANKKYIISGSKDGSVKIINLESPDSAYWTFYNGNNESISHVSISPSNQFAIFSSINHAFILDINNMIYEEIISNKFHIGPYRIRKIGNKEYYLSFSLNSLNDRSAIYTCSLPTKKIRNIECDGRYIPVFSKSGNYIVSSLYHSKRVKVLKFKVPKTRDLINIDKDVVGAKFESSNNCKKLKVFEDKKFENFFFSENFEFIVFSCANNVHVWDTVKNEIIQGIKIGIKQIVLGVSHGFLFIQDLDKKIIYVNLKTNEIKFIYKDIKDSEGILASISQDLKIIFSMTKKTFEIIDAEKSSKLFSDYVYDWFNYYWICNHVYIISINLKKISFLEIKTGDIFTYDIQLDNDNWPYFYLFMSADERYLLVLSENSNSVLFIDIENRVFHDLMSIDIKSNFIEEYFPVFKNTPKHEKDSFFYLSLMLRLDS